MEVVEAQEDRAEPDVQPEHQAAESLQEARAGLIRLDRERRGEIRMDVAQLGENSRGLGKPDGLDIGCKSRPVGDGAEELGNRLVGQGVLPGLGGRSQDESSISEVPSKRLHKAGLANTRLARDQHDLAATGPCLGERLAQAAAGFFASHQGHVEAWKSGPRKVRGAGHRRWSPVMQGALVNSASLRQRADAELPLQDGGAALELAERAAAVPGGGVEGDEATVDILRQLIGGEVAAG
jgi:hypothetical protein